MQNPWKIIDTDVNNVKSVGMNSNKIPQKYNLHTHTYRCRHASGDTADYAAAAAAAGAELLGFTEHPPLFSNAAWDPFRMTAEELDGYFNSIAETAEKYPSMRILTGFEMDLLPRFKSYYEDNLLCREGIDYLIGGVHWINYHGDWLWIQEMNSAGHLREYVNEIAGLMESRLMSFITHPDMFASGYTRWDDNSRDCSRDILAAAEEYSVPLEINGNGFRKPEISTPDGPRYAYPLPEFWELAAGYDITVVCNSDAHKPENTMSDLDKCHDIINRFNLKHHPVQSMFSDAS